MQTFSMIDHIYPTRFSDNSFKTCNFNLNLTQLVLEVQQYGINFLQKMKSLVLVLLYLKPKLKKKF